MEAATWQVVCCSVSVVGMYHVFPELTTGEQKVM
jgi:hypothetical protein